MLNEPFAVQPIDLYFLGLDAFQQAYICMEAIIQGDYSSENTVSYTPIKAVSQ